MSVVDVTSGTVAASVSLRPAPMKITRIDPAEGPRFDGTADATPVRVFRTSRPGDVRLRYFVILDRGPLLAAQRSWLLPLVGIPVILGMLVVGWLRRRERAAAEPLLPVEQAAGS